MNTIALEETGDRRMTVENAEVNILYTTAYAIFLIVNDLERRLNKRGSSLGGRKKQLFNRLLKNLRLAKSVQDELYEDYLKAWGNNATKNITDEQLNANSLARLLLLWFDRVEGYEQYENAIEEIIGRLPEDCITKETLNIFRVR